MSMDIPGILRNYYQRNPGDPNSPRCEVCGLQDGRTRPSGFVEYDHTTDERHVRCAERTELLRRGMVPIWGLAVSSVLNRLKVGCPADDYEFWHFDWTVSYPGVEVHRGVTWIPRDVAGGYVEDPTMGVRTRKVLRTALLLEGPWWRAMGEIRDLQSIRDKRLDLSGLTVSFPDDYRFSLSQTMVEPLRRRLNYQSIGRQVFMVEELPPGALPVLYGRHP